jgi:hypothetical protein
MGVLGNVEVMDSMRKRAMAVRNTKVKTKRAVKSYQHRIDIL